MIQAIRRLIGSSELSGTETISLGEDSGGQGNRAQQAFPLGYRHTSVPDPAAFRTPKLPGEKVHLGRVPVIATVGLSRMSQATWKGHVDQGFGVELFGAHGGAEPVRVEPPGGGSQ